MKSTCVTVLSLWLDIIVSFITPTEVKSPFSKSK